MGKSVNAETAEKTPSLAQRLLEKFANESMVASKFATFSRQQRRQSNANKAMDLIDRVAGGEPRRARRSMARARAKREWVKPAGAKA